MPPSELVDGVLERSGARYGGVKLERSKPHCSKAKAKKYAATRSESKPDGEATVLVCRESPLVTGNADTSHVRRDRKLLREYDDAIRRRDFERVLWAIANGDASADRETENGETAILAAVAAKDGDALRMLVSR